MNFLRYLARFSHHNKRIAAALLAAGHTEDDRKASPEEEPDSRPVPESLSTYSEEVIPPTLTEGEFKVELTAGAKGEKVKARSVSRPCINPGYYKPCERDSLRDVKEMDAGGECKDRAAEQLNEFKRTHSSAGNLTTSAGALIANKTAVLSTGIPGAVLLQDFVFLDEMAHFNRERVPERVSGAKGAGAFGTFELTDDISKYSKAAVFGKVGKKTPVAVRFSLFNGENGSVEAVRDVRGFSIKFYTEEGIFDLIGMNMPVFFIRDPPLFPSLMHAMKRNPVTHLKDADAFWDFMSLRPETTHLLLMLFSARGIPLNFRQMHGYGVHAFKLINKNNNVFYCKFHIKTNQGVKNLTSEDAEKQIIADPDNATHDLYNAIGDKQLPVWTVYMQVMSEEDAYAITKYNPFDPTKVWPHKEFPLIQVGKLTLNRNPKNYFSEVEQMAFSPAHLVPGIEPSPDLLLQGRLFAYSDAHRYRLGVNYLQIPVNTSPALKIKHYMRDGLMSGENQEGAPNYHPNSFNGPVEKPGIVESNIFIPETEAQRFISETDSDFIQAKVFYSTVLSDEGRNVLVWNIAESLKKAHANIQEQVLKNFARVDAGLARKVEERLSYYKNTCEA